MGGATIGAALVSTFTALDPDQTLGRLPGARFFADAIGRRFAAIAAGAPALATARAGHPDAELIELGRQFDEITAALDREIGGGMLGHGG
jgi:hypothetical protein